MDIVGYKFVDSQDEFEQWQKNNPTFRVKTVQPHMQSLEMLDGKKQHQQCFSGTTKWGVFVTFLYDV